MATSSIYQPLDQDRLEIRVLHVQGSPAKEDELRCELEIISLLADPIRHYESVSYCWAEVSGTASLVVNGQTVDAPGSAVKVIRRF